MDKKRMLKNAVHVFLALCFLFVLYFVIPDEGVLEFSERDCLLLFDCTSSDFFDKEMDFYEETGDFRKNARINGEGNLEIHLDEKQMIAWKESAWLNVFNDIENCPYANLSTDLSILTVHYTSEFKELLEDSASYTEISDYLNRLIRKVFIIKWIDGIEPGEAILLYNVIDSETGEVIHSELIK